jgi:hypothetical protein
MGDGLKRIVFFLRVRSTPLAAKKKPEFRYLAVFGEVIHFPVAGARFSI